MKPAAIFIALLFLVAAIAGCATKSPPEDTTSTTAPITEQPAATPETPAAPQEVAVPDDIVGENPDTGALNDVSVDTRTLG